MLSKPKPPTIKPKFQTKKVTKKVLGTLPERMQDVLIERFGLENGIRKTLDSIGKRYGITRERVRQIENAAITMIKKTESYDELRDVFTELKAIIDDHGGVVHEEAFFETVYPHDPISQNHLFFYLTLGEDFFYTREDSEFKTTWSHGSNALVRVRTILKSVAKSLEENKLFEESDLVERIIRHEIDTDTDTSERKTDHIKSWLNTSHIFGKNKLGHWGLSSSYNISTRGVRDYAYLVLHQHGSPMHFRDIAQAIADKFGKPVHVATCHNTLISDPRFVLIGRGLYALIDWGYSTGTARDVIVKVLEAENRPLTRKEVIELVNRERHLKENTILVNLHNSPIFKKDELGRYMLNPEYNKSTE
jgi:Sigma-70, region 4/HB1, ASXL, restriction endonuclease HTH domain